VIAKPALPAHYRSELVPTLFHIPYLERANQAREFAHQHGILAAQSDARRTCLLLVDVQNTFCTPGFELVVPGAVDDNQRLCEFIYRNLGEITAIVLTLDTHSPFQIFQPFTWVDATLAHPVPGTIISVEDVERGRWRINPQLAGSGAQEDYQRLDDEYARHYVRKLAQKGRYPLTIWPPHGMAGSIGHALVPAVEEAIYFHSIARYAAPRFLYKGESPLTEHYAVFESEVDEDQFGRPVGTQHRELLRDLLAYDRLIVAGQAKSHCVAWTVQYMIEKAMELGGEQMANLFLLEDCTSPVVIPGVYDYTEDARAAFARFAEAGAHPIPSTRPLSAWPP